MSPFPKMPWSWLVALVATVFAGDRLLAAGLENLVLRSQQRFSLAYRGGQRNDVLILGDSRGVNAFYAPAIRERTGLRTLNLSFNGMSTECAEAVFRDYLDRNDVPRLLVLEVTNLRVASDLLTELKLYAGHSERVRRLLAERYPEASSAGRLFHLFRFNGELFLRALFYLRSGDQSWINRYRISPAVLASAAAAPEQRPASLPGNVAALKRMIVEARKRGIEVELVVSPYLPEYVARIVGLDEWVEELELTLGGSLRVRNDARAISSHEGFADRLHLNEVGGRAYLEGLIKRGFFDTARRSGDGKEPGKTSSAH